MTRKQRLDAPGFVAYRILPERSLLDMGGKAFSGSALGISYFSSATVLIRATRQFSNDG